MVRAHARATERLLRDPDAAFEPDVDEANRIVALGPERAGERRADRRGGPPLGVSTRMLRHYDSLGLVRPTGRTVGGYREYSAGDIRRIFHVESLRLLGLSLRQIGRALEDPPSRRPIWSAISSGGPRTG